MSCHPLGQGPVYQNVFEYLWKDDPQHSALSHRSTDEVGTTKCDYDRNKSLEILEPIAGYALHVMNQDISKFLKSVITKMTSLNFKATKMNRHGIHLHGSTFNIHRHVVMKIHESIRKSSGHRKVLLNKLFVYVPSIPIPN